MNKNKLDNNFQEDDYVVVLGSRDCFLHGKILKIKENFAEILIEDSVHLIPKNKIYKNTYRCGNIT